MDYENRKPMMSQREVKKAYESMLKLGDLSKPVVQNKVNCYRCSCGNVIKTIDVNNGTTPFMIQCDICDTMATSTMYRDIAPDKEPTIEWYRPTLEECIKMRKKPNVLEHILMGGLEMRKIKKNGK